MSKISKSRDLKGTPPPSFSAGTQPWENPGIQPNDPGMTPGEKASNDVTEFTMSKAQPFKKKGAGVTG